MATLATDLLRTTTRAFYPTEHILVIDALILHSTLPDTDLAHLLGMQIKPLRKLCGRLKDDGLLSVQTRQEKRTDGSASFYAPSSQNGQAKERVTNKEWFYLNYHRAIDSIKYRMFKLNRHFSALGMPTTERKELNCPQCKSQWTELEVMDKIDFATGEFLCRRCGHALDRAEESEQVAENEGVKRLNSQLEKILALMQQIDAATVPENDWHAALSRHKPITRTDVNPANTRVETVDLPAKGSLLSSKGLALQPEKIAVSLQSDEEVRKANAEAEARERREREARQNALPDWIAKSTVSGDITTVGAKAERERKEREAHSGLGLAVKSEEEERKAPLPGGDADMAKFWIELEEARAQEAAERAAEEEDDDDEDEEGDEEEEEEGDDFEDVPVVANGGTTAPASTGASTPAAVESSNATDDEREAKRRRVEAPNGVVAAPQEQEKAGVEGTPAASDEDEDELEFENV